MIFKLNIVRLKNAKRKGKKMKRRGKEKLKVLMIRGMLSVYRKRW